MVHVVPMWRNEDMEKIIISINFMEVWKYRSGIIDIICK